MYNMPTAVLHTNRIPQTYHTRDVYQSIENIEIYYFKQVSLLNDIFSVTYEHFSTLINRFYQEYTR